MFNSLGIEPQSCSNHENVYCIQWQDKAQVKIAKVNDHCEMHEMSTELDKPLSVAFDLEGVHVFGGTQVINQSWPAEKANLNHTPYVSIYLL